MYIDEALKNVLSILNSILIPGSEARKMEAAKSGIAAVITSTQNARAKEQEGKTDEA